MTSTPYSRQWKRVGATFPRPVTRGRFGDPATVAPVGHWPQIVPRSARTPETRHVGFSTAAGDNSSGGDGDNSGDDDGGGGGGGTR